MTLAISPNGTIELRGACPVEEAEELLQHLLTAPNATVDWRSCESAHTAVIQVLLVAKTIPLGPPIGRFLREHVEPQLRRAASE
jgi:hypothetical protein